MNKAIYIFKGIIVICIIMFGAGTCEYIIMNNVFDFKTDYEPEKEVTFECKEWLRVK